MEKWPSFRHFLKMWITFLEKILFLKKNYKLQKSNFLDIPVSFSSPTSKKYIIFSVPLH